MVAVEDGARLVAGHLHRDALRAGRTVATAKTLPVQIELKEADYFVLLKHAPRRSRVSAR
jgi:hypothetical protein